MSDIAVDTCKMLIFKALHMSRGEEKQTPTSKCWNKRHKMRGTQVNRRSDSHGKHQGKLPGNKIDI